MSSPAVSAARAWANRIVGSDEEAPDQLLANPANWRIHGKAQRAALREVLHTVGCVAQVIVNQRTSHLIDGHLRVEEALSHEQRTIPIPYIWGGFMNLPNDPPALKGAGLYFSQALI